MTFCRRCQNRLTPEEETSAWSNRCTACRPTGTTRESFALRQCSACGADLPRYTVAQVSICDPCFRLNSQRLAVRHRRRMRA